MRLPAEPVLNSQLTQQLGKPVLMLDVIPVETGERLRITFKSQSGDWRQGVWMGVDGLLAIGGHRADQFEIWTDTAQLGFDVEVLQTTDGLLRLYNIWDSGRGRRRESQSATSGMLKETNQSRTTYRCNDIGREPAFDKLVFDVDRR